MSDTEAEIPSAGLSLPKGEQKTKEDPKEQFVKGIAEHKQHRAVLLGQLTKAKNYIAANIDKLSVFQLETKLGLLESQFANFNIVQSQIERLNKDEINSSKRDTYEDTYCNLKSQMLEKLEDIKPRSSFDMSAFSSTIHTPSSRLQLPKLQLTKFSGLHTEWLDFFEMFSTLVHKNVDLTEIEKFQHLRTCLTGNAAKTIASLETSSKNYKKAIDLLKARFDNKRYIFQAHINKIFELQAISKGTVSNIRSMVDTINGHIRALLSIGTNSQVADGLLLHLLLTKLDSDSQTKWEEEIAAKVDLNTSQDADVDHLRFPTWDDLSKFLEKRCQTIEIIESNKRHFASPSTSHKSPVRRLPSAPSLHSTFVSSSKDSSCLLCGSSPTHSPFACTKFIALSPVHRFNMVKQLDLCNNCLRTGHRVQFCRSSNKCQHCNQPHHTLLHMNTATMKREVTQKSNELPPTQSSASALCSSSHNYFSNPFSLQSDKANRQIVLATALVALQNDKGKWIICRALLDSASQLNFLTEHIAQQLGVHRQPINMTINGIGTASTRSRHQCTVRLKSLHTEFWADLSAVILRTITTSQPHQSIDINHWNIPKNVTLADPLFNKPQTIDLLIGASLFFDLIAVGQIRSGERLPILQKTVLGWVVSGEIESNSSTSSLSHVQHTSLLSTSPVTSHSNLDNLIQRFWEIEDYKTTSHNFSKEESECEDFYKSTTSRCPTTGKFIVRLPLREDPSSLGPSQDIAYRRLCHIERRLSRSPSLRADYIAFMEEYKTLHHMTLAASSSSSYFIPHHCVVKPESSSTKVRVVFDASCRTLSGKSLNDILKVGPTLQDTLFSIIIRFRTHRYVITSDITKMYRQVLINPLDSNLQCILWRDDPQSKAQTYRLDTVTYGTSCAPYLAVRSLRQLAIENTTVFPIGSNATLNDFYVDNLMTGADTIAEVIAIKSQVTKLLQIGSFELRKWAANDPELIADIAQEDRETVIRIGDNDIVKALGLGWTPIQDNFVFNYIETNNHLINKRSILSETARFFDPLGLINPIIVKAKIFLQQLWKLQFHWDESLPQFLQTQWIQFRQQLRLINYITVHRRIRLLNSRVQLHGFADASTKAFGACVYVRSIDQSGAIIVNLLCAKSRVAPIKTVSLPRLELCAALLLTELLQTINQSIAIDIEHTFCWSDSSIALAWIGSESHIWTTFVANRVSKIHDLSKSATWNHVPSELNPADLVSRGCLPEVILNNEFWFHGPQFLQQPFTSWPKSTHEKEDIIIPEYRKTHLIALIASPVTDLVENCKYSNSYLKLLRVFCYIRRFLRNKSHEFKVPSDGPITFTTIEVEDALHSIVRNIQHVHFATEIHRLENNQQVHNRSVFKPLSPFLHNGILRVGGRIAKSALSYDSSHQILLPKSHTFTIALIRYLHMKHLHAGCQSLLNILREKFWIVGAKSIIRQVIHHCIICFHSKPRVAQQMMGNLPQDRITPSRPFAITGIDYCGPLYVSQRTRKASQLKSYVAVFVCFTTKATHLELVSDLSTNSFIAALKRFIARRGKCSKLYSDNGTNFVGANRELQDLHTLYTSQQHNHSVQQFCVEDGIEWNFIPPRSPHFGGLWEAAVKSAKFHLKRIIGKASLNHEEISTILCQVEAVLNSRPLTPMSSDPNDLSVLTPGHFLIGAPMTTIPEPTIIDIDLNRLKRYKHMQWLQQSFWLRWSREYLHELQHRTKWTSIQPNISIGQLVLIQEENTSPLYWHFGRIVAIHEGTDHRIRVASIKTHNSIIKRAFSKLCPLPME